MAPHLATSVNYCKYLIIEPAFCGSIFSTGRLLAIEDFTFTLGGETDSATREKKNGVASPRGAEEAGC